jgi:hypothetical protein
VPLKRPGPFRNLDAHWPETTKALKIQDGDYDSEKDQDSAFCGRSRSTTVTSSVTDLTCDESLSETRSEAAVLDLEQIPKLLPSNQDKGSFMRTISAETFAEVKRGTYGVRFLVVDCRFGYEYQGKV